MIDEQKCKESLIEFPKSMTFFSNFTKEKQLEYYIKSVDD